jgi:hypothetical protein
MVEADSCICINGVQNSWNCSYSRAYKDLPINKKTQKKKKGGKRASCFAVYKNIGKTVQRTVEKRGKKGR